MKHEKKAGDRVFFGRLIRGQSFCTSSQAAAEHEQVQVARLQELCRGAEFIHQEEEWWICPATGRQRERWDMVYSPEHCTENRLVLAQDKRGPGFCSQGPSGLEILIEDLRFAESVFWCVLFILLFLSYFILLSVLLFAGLYNWGTLLLFFLCKVLCNVVLKGAVQIKSLMITMKLFPIGLDDKLHLLTYRHCNSLADPKFTLIPVFEK